MRKFDDNQWYKILLFTILVSLFITIVMFTLYVGNLIDKIESDNKISKQNIIILKEKNVQPPPIIKIPVTVTAYNSTVAQCDDTPFTTAFNTRVHKDIVALSRPLEKDYKMKKGDKITLVGIGTFEFEDRMNQEKWPDYRVDIWMENIKDAREFGVKQTVAILHRGM